MVMFQVSVHGDFEPRYALLTGSQIIGGVGGG